MKPYKKFPQPLNLKNLFYFWTIADLLPEAYPFALDYFGVLTKNKCYDSLESNFWIFPIKRGYFAGVQGTTT